MSDLVRASLVIGGSLVALGAAVIGVVVLPLSNGEDLFVMYASPFAVVGVTMILYGVGGKKQD